jgi:uncharacterized protein (TIGR02284 family)
METKTASAIKDLIVINNDRYEGYKTAAKETTDADLKSMFNEFSNQSQQFSQELRKFVTSPDEQPKRDETKATGKLYRVWMDLRSAVSGKDRKTILSSCEYGEDVAKKHYEEAISDAGELSSEAVNVIQKQKEEIVRAHDKVKAMRDSAA